MHDRRTRLVASRRTETIRAALVGGAIGLALAGCSLFGSSTPSPATASAPGASGTATSPSPSASASPASPAPSPLATASPTPLPTTALALCRPAKLAAHVTLWEGATGHRIGHVQLVNKGAVACIVRAMSRPQLVDGIGSIIIDGAAPAPSAAVTVAPGAMLKTLVQDGNYCKATPIPPMTVAFVLGGGAGRIVATPVSPTDVGGVPPCLGAPGSAGTIAMQPWS